MIAAAAFALLVSLPTFGHDYMICSDTVPDIVGQAVALRAQGVPEAEVPERITVTVPAGVLNPMAYLAKANLMREVFAQFAFLPSTTSESYAYGPFFLRAVSMAEAACIDALGTPDKAE